MSQIAFALQLLNVLPGLVNAGINVATLIQDSRAALQKMQDENRDPTPEEWDALNQKIRDLRQALHAPGP